jgi:sugar O-acyltransferase (sialic acid O-acetyltransferase NeuD family)
MSGQGRLLFGIYGVSGCGRGVLPVAAAMLAARHSADEYELVFIDDARSAPVVNGRQVLTYEEFRQREAGERAVNIAIANSRVRERLAARCAQDGIGFFSVAAANTVVMDAVEIGAGAILSPFVTVTSNVRIGRHFHANLYSYVEHDCVIGDFVTFAPGVHCNGNIVIHDHAYLGSGCILRQGRPDEPLVIGAHAIVGMGAIVTRSVPAGTTVVGNPARPLLKS